MKEIETKNKPSGNDFQYKVKKTLESLGWIVRVSPYYNDMLSDKPREIDLIAEKVFPPVPNSYYKSQVVIRLIIECKYVAKRTVFWFQPRNIESAKEIVNSTNAFFDAEKYFSLVKEHHYLSDKPIATLGETEGVTSEGDPVFKAVTQCLHATIYFRNQPTNASKSDNHRNIPSVELNYPVIVYNSFDKFFKKDTTLDDENESAISEPFQCERDYAYTLKDKPISESFLIDMVSLDNLSHFEIDFLLKEVNMAKNKISDDAAESLYGNNSGANESYFSSM